MAKNLAFRRRNVVKPVARVTRKLALYQLREYCDSTLCHFAEPDDTWEYGLGERFLPFKFVEADSTIEFVDYGRKFTCGLSQTESALPVRNVMKILQNKQWIRNGFFIETCINRTIVLKCVKQWRMNCIDYIRFGFYDDETDEVLISGVARRPEYEHPRDWSIAHIDQILNVYGVRDHRCSPACRVNIPEDIVYASENFTVNDLNEAGLIRYIANEPRGRHRELPEF
jgi:hypothetical protein